MEVGLDLGFLELVLVKDQGESEDGGKAVVAVVVAVVVVVAAARAAFAVPVFDVGVPSGDFPDRPGSPQVCSIFWVPQYPPDFTWINDRENSVDDVLSYSS